MICRLGILRFCCCGYVCTSLNKFLVSELMPPNQHFLLLVVWNVEFFTWICIQSQRCILHQSKGKESPWNIISNIRHMFHYVLPMSLIDNRFDHYFQQTAICRILFIAYFSTDCRLPHTFYSIFQQICAYKNTHILYCIFVCIFSKMTASSSAKLLKKSTCIYTLTCIFT